MSQESTRRRSMLLNSSWGTFHLREDGYINVLDIERIIPEKEQRDKSWAKFWAQAYGTLASLARRYGIPTADMVQSEYTGDGAHFIWAQPDLALDFASYINPDLRADILITYRRVLSGDMTLAAEIADRSPEDEQQRWLRARQELKGHTRLRNLAIKQHQGEGRIYGYCADELNKATTGRTRREIRALTHVRDTRDALDTSHLALQLLGENEQIKAMDCTEAQGNTAIKEAVDPVHGEIRDIALRFNLHNDNLLRNRAHLLQSPPRQARAAIAPPSVDVSLYPCRDYRGETAFYPDVPLEDSEAI